MTNSGSLVLTESARSLPIVHCSISALSGAMNDPAGLEGLSRFSTRLMRRTAAGNSFTEVEERIDAMGASVGMDCGHGNASISGAVLSRNFEQFSQLLLEMFHGPGLQQSEMERLKRETVAEFLDILDDDEQLVNRWFTRTVFDTHPYGRTVLGTSESIEKIDVSDVQRCLQRHFTQGSLVVGFAGAVASEDVEAFVQRLDAGLPQYGESPQAVREPQISKGRRLVFVDKPERSQTQILMGGLGGHPQDADYIDLVIANTVFGGTFTARLSQEVRAKRGWSYGAYSSVAYERMRQAFSLWTFPAAADAAACLKLKFELLESWWQQGITSEELQRAKNYLTQSFAFARDTTSKRIGLSLEAVLLNLPKGFYDTYLQQIEAVTLESANAAIRNRISLQDMVISVVGTHAEVGSAIEDAIGGLQSSTVTPFNAP